MGIISNNYTWVFDDVQFGIDIRQAREKRGLTQLLVAQALGYESASTVVFIEQARKEAVMKVTTFMRLCQMFDLHPEEYFDFVKAETVEYFQLMG